MGAALGQNPVRLYRSSDSGRTWTLAARSASVNGAEPSGSGLPVACGKTSVAVSPAGTGWITGDCPAGLTGAVLASRDGGAHWASPPLPIPASACQQDGCDVAAPQFAGRTTFLVISDYPDAALLVVTMDGGATWRTTIMPAGAGPYPRVRFFGQADGIAVSAGSQGSIGRDFYRTLDGGRTWTAVRQGKRFGLGGGNFDFVSPIVGFAWIPGTLPMYQMSDSGRSWTAFVPRLG